MSCRREPILLATLESWFYPGDQQNWFSFISFSPEHKERNVFFKCGSKQHGKIPRILKDPLLKEQKNCWSWKETATMGGGTAHGTLSPQWAPLQTGIKQQSHLWQVSERKRNGHTYPVWMWGSRSLEIPSPGPIFHGTKWLFRRPHVYNPALHS
jgi:hypothetical protein